MTPARAWRRPAGAATACALLTLALAGCYTPDGARLSAQAAQRAPAGAPVAAAVEQLTGDGFRCDAQSRAPDIDCSRSRQGALLYACIERVILQPDATGRTVASLEIPPIACAGL